MKLPLFDIVLVTNEWWKTTRDFDFFRNKYPLIMGADVGGLIEEVGEGVSHLHKGQRVIG